MPAQVVTLEDVDRRLKDIERELPRIAERATRREEEFGAVRSQAARVESLKEEVRELSRIINRLTGGGVADPENMSQTDVESALAKAARMSRAIPVAAAPPPASMQSTQASAADVLDVLRNKGVPTSKSEAVSLVVQALQTAATDPDLREAMQAFLVNMIGDQLRGLGVTLPTTRVPNYPQPRRRG